MELETRAVVPYQNLPLADRGRAWDADGARRRVAKWAGYDGEDKDTVDWGKYRKAFVLYDRENPENFGSYKLIIADIVNGRLKAIPRGIFAAAVVLQGGRRPVQGFDEGDIEGAKRHISRYYKKMGEVAPWDREEDSFEWLPEELEFVEYAKLGSTADRANEASLVIEARASAELLNAMEDLRYALNRHSALLERALSEDGVAELEKEIEELEQDLEASERRNQDLQEAYDILRETLEELGA